MKLKLKQFLSNQNFVFIPAFFAFSLLSEWLRHQSIELFGFPGEIISVATLQNVDVNARIALFYNALILLFLLYIILRFLSGFIEQKLKDNWLFRTLNVLSFIGIALLFFQLFNSSIGFSINLILILMFWAIPFSFIASGHKQRTLKFIWLSTLSFSLASLFRLLNGGFIEMLQNFEFLFPLAFAIILLIYFLYSNKNEKLNKLLKASLPLYSIPIIFFLSEEIYLIFNQHEIFILSPKSLYLFFLIVLLAFCVLIYRRSANQFDIKQYLSLYVYPITLIGFVIITYYTPIWEQTGEMFEAANPSNALMRWFVYGEIPILEAQSSHLLADYIFKFLYTLFNGYDGSLAFYNYKFLHLLILYLPAYYFLGKILKSYRFAFVFLLFFPYVDITFGTLAIALLTPLMFYRLYQNYSFNTLVLYLLLLLFLLFWRPDIGVANLAGGLVLLLVFLSAFWSRQKGRDLLKALILIGLIVLIPVIIIVNIKDIDLLLNVHKSLDYFGGSQAHGFAEITKKIDRYYLIHYFVFPIISLVVLVYFGSKAIGKNKLVSFFILSIIFLSVFYFVYAQRGLVRHSLFEGSDTFISNFIYFLFGLLAIYLFKNKKVWLVFPIALSLLIVNFKYPDVFGRKNLIEKGFTALNHKAFLPSYSTKISRVKNIPKKESALILGDFNRFFDSNFDSNSTFLDFSNSPMLYFYTSRRVPSYFNQYMQNTVTAYLQEENIKTLSKLDVPIVVFSHNPLTWFDKTDGVLNTLRYNKISRYIYQNYTPFGTVGNYYLWLKNGVSIPDKTEGVDLDPDFAFNVVKQDLKKLPHLPGFIKHETLNVIHDWGEQNWIKNRIVLKLDSTIDGDQTALKLSVDNQNNKNVPLHLKYMAGKKVYFEIKFTLFANENDEYVVPLSWIYSWYLQKGKRLIISTKKSSEIQINNVSIIKMTD